MCRTRYDYYELHSPCVQNKVCGASRAVLLPALPVWQIVFGVSAARRLKSLKSSITLDPGSSFLGLNDTFVATILSLNPSSK